jgi:hypothetical protein
VGGIRGGEPGGAATGRQAWSLLWRASRPLAWLTVAWVIATAVMPALVVVALGNVVGDVPGTVVHGSTGDAATS